MIFYVWSDIFMFLLWFFYLQETKKYVHQIFMEFQISNRKFTLIILWITIVHHYSTFIFFQLLDSMIFNHFLFLIFRVKCRCLNDMKFLEETDISQMLAWEISNYWFDKGFKFDSCFISWRVPGTNY